MTRLGAVTVSEKYRAARESLAHRVRASAVIDIGGKDGFAFLQGQLTQDVRAMAAGETRPAAALNPKGKLLFLARVVGLDAERRRLLLPASERETALAHLKKFVIFQKVEIADRSEDFVRMSLYGPGASEFAAPAGSLRLPADGEFGAEVLAPSGQQKDLEVALERAGSVEVDEATADVLRIEAGRPRFGRDADSSNLADEVGLDRAISTTKGCYVGQEIVARMRTYGRANRRLVGFRFPDGPIEAGSILMLPEENEPGKIEQGRVTSAVESPALGAIGLGYAFREVRPGGRLVSAAPPARGALVATLPFTE